jgi:hypothetical protein
MVSRPKTPMFNFRSSGDAAGRPPPDFFVFSELPSATRPRFSVRHFRSASSGISGQHPLQMLFIFASTFGSSARISASPGMDGPGVTVPSIRWPDAPFRAIPVVDAFPGDPVEFAVPKVLVPGAVGVLTELPAPLGSLPELLMPPAFAGPFGTPLTAAVPAPGAPAFGEPTALPVPTLGPLAAPAAEVPPTEVPPADPPVCASAKVPVSASAVANAKTVAFMSVPFA